MSFHDHWRRAWASPRTTVMGIGAILAAVGDILTQIGTKSYDAQRLATDLGVIFAGIAGVFAKDA